MLGTYRQKGKRQEDGRPGGLSKRKERNERMENKMKRGSGVLLPVFSLPGDYGCGSFGDEAKSFVDFLVKGGFSYWQVLPFCMVDPCNSPYQSYSAFGGNPYFVDLPTLHRQGLLTGEELASARQKMPYSCEYDRLIRERMPLLRRAASRVQDRCAILNFIAGNRHLEQFCRFMALKSANGGKPWHEWTVQEPQAEEVFAWQFTQYAFFSQWREIKAYANDRGIGIIGDIPIYVSYDSCDVWADRALFQLDRDGRPLCVAGVPPDYFSEDGQLWGNPLYDWNRMAADGFSWWDERIRHMFTLFDGVRIDHFRGFDTYWSVPYGAATAKEGSWIPGPGRALVDVLKTAAEGHFLIAEDLGESSESVDALLQYSGFPGMRVMQFAFESEDDNRHLPHNYPENCIAYTGTHDNNTLLGYVWALDEAHRKTMLEYCGFTEANWDRGYDSIIRTLFESHAGIVILPVQDLLGFGSDTRYNLPGTDTGNWLFRVTGAQLAGIDSRKYHRLNALYRRLRPQTAENLPKKKEEKR